MALVLLTLAGLHHFYFAKLVQAAFCKYHGVIPTENYDTLSAFSFHEGKGRWPKQNVAFHNFPRNSLHLHAYSLLLLYARKNRKAPRGTS